MLAPVRRHLAAARRRVLGRADRLHAGSRSAADVHPETADLDRARLVRGRTGRPPQQGVDPCTQFDHAERLRHVVVSAQVERGDFVRLAVARRQDEDRGRGLAPDTADHDQAVLVRQPEIEHDEVGPLALPSLRRGREVGGLDDFVVVPAQEHGDRSTGRFVILDQEDRGSGSRVHEASSTAFSEGAMGTSKSTARPPRELRRATTCPPMASMRPRTTARPIPVPRREPSPLRGTR